MPQHVKGDVVIGLDLDAAEYLRDVLGQYQPDDGGARDLVAELDRLIREHREFYGDDA